MTDTELLALVREWQSLCELAEAQAATPEKTVKARDSKHSQMMWARKQKEVLR